MLRTYLVAGTVIALSVVAAPARADHDRELTYVLGGALIGAAIGGIAYESHRHARHAHHYAVAHHYYVYPRVRHYAPAYGVRHVRGHGRYYRGRHHGHRGYRHFRHHH